jgi:uncharacterized protein (TIGR02145 family)
MSKLWLLSILTVPLFCGCVSIGFGDNDKCGGENYTALNQICEDGTLKNPCGNGYYNPAMQFCNGNEVLDKCDGKEYESAMYECKEGILLNKCGNETFVPSIEYCTDGAVNKKEEFIDSRDGKKYKYVSIGTQIWMSENIRYETSNTKCYGDEPDNCEIFGMLYGWANAVCPSGWHLPSDHEWDTLIDFVENNSECNDCAGAKLKANGTLWVSGQGTDDFGFTALPGGYYKNNFEKIGEVAVFWSIRSDGNLHRRYLKYNNDVLNSDGLLWNYDWANVRCIKD